MSALRRLTSSFRSERRSEQACPYSRPQPSPPKPKPTRRPRYWDFFNFFSFLAPYSDEEEEEAKKEAEAKAKASEQTIVPDQDAEMTDTDVSASSTEESTTTTTDSSLETAETAECVEAVEPAKLSEPVQPTRIAEPLDAAECSRPVESIKRVMSVEPVEPTRIEESSVSTQTSVSSVSPLPQPSDRPVTSDIGVPSSSTVPPEFTSDDDFLEWVKRKADAHETMNDMDFLGFKMFMENRRKGLQHEPIKLRFMPRHASPSSTSSTKDDAPIAGSSHSAFSSSTRLPPFKNNVASRPPRMLKEDPNGPLELRGAGSARIKPEAGRKRPAPLVKLRFDPYKRRRLFEEARGPTPKVNGAISRSMSSDPAGRSTTGLPRIIPNGQNVAPHSPSPLRNVITGSPPSSPSARARAIPTNLSATGSRSTPANQTASAAFLQGVVEKVVPRRPRYSDVVNPYQTAAPVKPVFKPMEKKRMSERRARTKEAGNQKDAVRVKESEGRELSAKEIIEATVPKGAKRSRPPPGLTKSRAANVIPGVTSKRVLEEPEEEQPSTKKRRTVTVEEVSEEENVKSRSFPAKPNVIIESRSPSPEPISVPSYPSTELPIAKDAFTRASSVKETAVKTASMAQPTHREAPVKASSAKESPVKVPAAKEQGSKSPLPTKVASAKESSTRLSSKGSSAKGPSNHFSPLLNSKMTGKSSVPREPSKLRTSFLPDECENEEPKMASPTPSATITMTTPGTPLADIQEKKDPKEVALTLPLNDLPSFIFKTPPALIAGDHTDARVAAKELPVTSLPKFDFSKARTVVNSVIFPAVPIPTIKPFDFESVAVEPNSAPKNSQWQCPTCMLQNSASAVEKCSICEAPRPGVEKPRKAAVNGINGVNGAKTPSSVNGKMSSPKVNSPFTSPTVKTFDFAAAGLTPKAPVANGQWTCSACMLQNPATSVEKCSVCDAPRPDVEKAEKIDRPKKPYMNGAAHTSNNVTKGISLPTVKSFDFVAAGLPPKIPTASGNWRCSTCMLQNPATVLEKCKVCDSPRPGMKKNVAPLPVVSAKSVSQLVPKSFDWATAGMVPTFNSNSWTCGTCMLSNPPTETEKCKVCDASRS
ncbi:hypothetical protein ACEPAH_3639 [Sanghuangporus vaninii]